MLFKKIKKTLKKVFKKLFKNVLFLVIFRIETAETHGDICIFANWLKNSKPAPGAKKKNKTKTEGRLFFVPFSVAHQSHYAVTSGFSPSLKDLSCL